MFSAGQHCCIRLYKVLIPVCRVSSALNFQNGVLKKNPVGDTHTKTLLPNPEDITCVSVLH